MKLSYIISALEAYAPLALQEKWDNSGLQTSLPAEAGGECSGALLCLDATEAVIAEAVARGCNLVVSHHPLIFKGLRSITGRTPAERTVAAAIRAGVAVYSSHTALDSTRGGISYEMAHILGAEPVRVLSPAETPMVMLSVTCPRAMAADVRLILIDSDAPGCDYYDVDNEQAAVTEGAGIPESVISHTPLCRVEATVKATSARAIAAALAGMPGGSRLKIDTVPLDNRDNGLGLGLVADFAEAISGAELVQRLRERFSCGGIKASLGYSPDARIRRIALCGGSGGEFIGAATASGAQAYITADVRYHDFADNADNPMAIFDIGHFESESCAKGIFYHIIKNKFPNFAVYFSEAEELPVKYL